jgi:hypothetical protein
MALRHQGELEPAQRPQPPSVEELELLELAHRTGQPLSLLSHLSASYREAWLAEVCQQDAAQARADAIAMRSPPYTTRRRRGETHPFRQTGGVLGWGPTRFA